MVSCVGKGCHELVTRAEEELDLYLHITYHFTNHFLIHYSSDLTALWLGQQDITRGKTELFKISVS